jgi:hypothetical protein
MPDVRDGDAVNRAVADHVRELREHLERGREEIERQKKALDELHGNTAENEAVA